MWLMTIFVGLLTLVLVTWLWDNVKRWRMPPGPFFWPVIGNVFIFFNGQFYLSFIELARKYGDVFSLKMGMRDVVVLNSLDAVRDALVKKGVEFAGRPKSLTLDLLSEGGKNIFFADYSPTWKLHRKLFHSAIRDYASGKKLEAMVHKSLKDIIAEFSNMEGKHVDLEDYIFKLVYNVICAAAFGVRYNMNDKDFQTLMKARKDFSSNHLSIADIYPSLRFLPTPSKTAMKKTIAGQLEIMQRQMEQHRETFDPNNLRDIADHMLMAQKDAEEEGIHDINSLTDTHLRQMINNIFGAGTDTTIATVQWAILLLAAHPEIQEKLAAELGSVVGRDRLPELTDREATPYMEATIHEVMRMGSIAPIAIPHSTTMDTTLGGYHIPKGTWVMPNLWAVHHDPSIWQDSETFRPDRFLDRNGQSIAKPSALMPFSVGRRSCPGEANAKADTFLLLGGLVQNFSFRIPEGEGPPVLTPDIKGGGTACPPYPYKVVMTGRM